MVPSEAMYAQEKGRRVFVIQKVAWNGRAKTKIIPSISAMFVRHIMPVCTSLKVAATSVVSSFVPSQSLMVRSRGCAWVGDGGSEVFGIALLVAGAELAAVFRGEVNSSRQAMQRHRSAKLTKIFMAESFAELEEKVIPKSICRTRSEDNV